MKDAVIVAGARTAVGRAPKGTLRATRPDDMAAAAIAEAVKRTDGLDPAEVEDVILGCAVPEGAQGLNVARLAALRAGLPESVPGQTVNRFCSSGLQAIAAASERIMAGFGTTMVAGGTESMSLAPAPAANFSPNPDLVRGLPEYYMAMGLTGEVVAERYGISREEQDAFALRSHQRAAEAVDSGRFDPEIVPLQVRFEWVDDGGELRDRDVTFARDEGPRRDTSAAALAKLKPSFKQGGTITAGNSSQRSDGAAAVVVMERGRARGDGRGPDGRRPQGPRAGGPDTRRHRVDRVERGVRVAEPGGDPRTGLRPGQGERQRRCDRARPPDGRHRDQAHHPAPGRDGPAQGPLRPGHHVRRRRDGRGRHLREPASLTRFRPPGW